MNKVITTDSNLINILNTVNIKNIYSYNQLKELLLSDQTILHFLQCDLLRPDIDYIYGSEVHTRNLDCNLDELMKDKFDSREDAYKYNSINKITGQYNIKYIDHAKNAIDTYIKLVNYLKKKTTSHIITDFKDNFKINKKIPLLDILYSKNKTINNQSSNINYRSWDIYSGPALDLLKNIILSKIDNTKTVRLSLQDLPIETTKHLSQVSSEFVYKFSKEDSIFVPELISNQPGRLLAKHLKFLKEEYQEYFSNQLQKSIDYNNYQVNIEINDKLDNLSFNLPFLKNKISFYDLNISENYIPISDLFVKLKHDDSLILYHHNKPINITLTSTISPTGDNLYTLFNEIDRMNNIVDLNGHGKSRIELNLDYQPRIIIDNLLLSRQRFRILKEEILTTLHKKNTSMMSIYNYFISKGIPYEVYVYHDRNYKPIYMQLLREDDIKSLEKFIKDAHNYIYLEEVYPNQEFQEAYITL